jgi:hypothetical protein
MAIRPASTRKRFIADDVTLRHRSLPNSSWSWECTGPRGSDQRLLEAAASDVYGDPNPWQLQPGGTPAPVIDFLNATKYPPCVLFLLMTLGPAAVLCALADRWTGVVKSALVTFGGVPFALYVPHVLLIYVMAVLLAIAQGSDARQFFTIFFFFPKGYGVRLPGVYALWAVVVIVLYPFCR